MSSQSDIGTARELYPLSPVEALRSRYIGKPLREVDAPAAIIDVAVVKKNCKSMLDTTAALGLGFRAHVKTHKTAELTRLQVGDEGDVKIIISTVAEAEHLLPYLQECKQNGRNVEVLLGVPPSSSCFERLNQVREALGSRSVSFLVDHPAQLRYLSGKSKDPVPIFVKVDSGYHRAGIPVSTSQFNELLHTILDCQNKDKPNVVLTGFYSHMGNSYGVESPQQALDLLIEEISQTATAAAEAKALGFTNPRFILSVGATPTATSTRAMLQDSPEFRKAVEKVETIKQKNDVEIHAGVYPVLDLQQLATHSATQSHANPTMTTADIGGTILVEVLSTYSARERPEVLIGAGTFALGREPCKSYPGWGIVSRGPLRAKSQARDVIIYNELSKTGWTVERIAQEHGILGWQGDAESKWDFEVGDKVLLWPNHACAAAAKYGWYLIIDSDKGTQDQEIVDVWVRGRGW